MVPAMKRAVFLFALVAALAFTAVPPRRCDDGSLVVSR